MAVDQQQQRAPTVPPHDLDAEESVLGAMLVSANASVLGVGLRPGGHLSRRHTATDQAARAGLWAGARPLHANELINSRENGGEVEAGGGSAAAHPRPSAVYRTITCRNSTNFS